MKTSAFCLLGLLGLAPVARATPLFDFAEGGTSTWNGAIYSLGYTFQVSAPYSFNAMGLYDKDNNGLGTAHALGLWDANGALIVSTTVSGWGSAREAAAAGHGEWVYQYLDQTISLANGIYTLAAYYPDGGADAVQRANDTAGLIQNVPGVTYLGYAYSDYNPPALVRPTNLGVGDNPFYFGPNLSTIAAPVPDAGSSLLLLGLAAGSAAVVHRRRPAAHR